MERNFLSEYQITCALLNADGRYSSVHYLCKGLIIVTVSILVVLKEEWLFLACSVFGWVKIVCHEKCIVRSFP